MSTASNPEQATYYPPESKMVPTEVSQNWEHVEMDVLDCLLLSSRHDASVGQRLFLSQALVAHVGVAQKNNNL